METRQEKKIKTQKWIDKTNEKENECIGMEVDDNQKNWHIKKRKEKREYKQNQTRIETETGEEKNEPWKRVGQTKKYEN